MFKIYDGRECFYQWDSDRKLIISDPTVKEVHFCNRTDDCALVVETYSEDGLYLADVPNILLQDDWRIKVYAYDGAATLHEACYEVVKRSRPADYAYTETEVLTWHKLDEKITKTIEEVEAAETEREVSEASRQNNEDWRIQSEMTRQNAENDRGLKEYQRQQAEAKRIEDENIRQSREMTRVIWFDEAKPQLETAITNAKIATSSASNAAGTAEMQGYYAYQATEAANTATENANREAGNANLEAMKAWQATEAANEATTKANEAADRANAIASGNNNIFANALKGAKSGTVAKLDDVSPVEHNVEVKLTSKNKFITSNITVRSNGSSAPAITNVGENYVEITSPVNYSASGGGYCPTGKKLRELCPELKIGDVITLSYKTDKEVSTKAFAFATSPSTTLLVGKSITVTQALLDAAVILYGSKVSGEVVKLYDIQIELSTTATPYTPYVADVTTTKLMATGKNLFENGAEPVPAHYTSASGVVSTNRLGYIFTLPAGIYTLSVVNKALTGGNEYIYTAVNDKNGKFVSTIKDSSGNYILNECRLFNTNGTVKTDNYVVIPNSTYSTMYKVQDGDKIFIYNAGSESMDITVALFGKVDLQLEAGDKVTEFEPYIEPVIYTPDAEGNVVVTSIYPTTTLYSDTSGVRVDAEYNRDINKAFAELQSALISMGGNV